MINAMKTPTKSPTESPSGVIIVPMNFMEDTSEKTSRIQNVEKMLESLNYFFFDIAPAYQRSQYVFGDDEPMKKSHLDDIDLGAQCCKCVEMLSECKELGLTPEKNPELQLLPIIRETFLNHLNDLRYVSRCRFIFKLMQYRNLITQVVDENRRDVTILSDTIYRRCPALWINLYRDAVLAEFSPHKNNIKNYLISIGIPANNGFITWLDNSPN
jgi:hypothetical protein